MASTPSASQDMDSLTKQNEELQKMKDNHTTEYTNQSYKLDRLQTAIWYNRMLAIAYWCVAVVSAVLILVGSWNWKVKAAIIIAIAVVPYVTYFMGTYISAFIPDSWK